ncbi:uncharacterized protein C8Q71DRAFT_719279 [Rhodofomes roseus]|uniref:Uncharacterized protein n=1 Tax=Rhodofomes roseus TaxID=34475 RepID=A0ABQ8KW07_9APHY|nr:uncharacterized protein C8Q71DRAFT_719279 [Rhodofomes roseus]KAH9843497.1 hypothetical protein C8Q71DRAFT_719279 [Rhodofomes roseus]
MSLLLSLVLQEKRWSVHALACMQDRETHKDRYCTEHSLGAVRAKDILPPAGGVASGPGAVSERRETSSSPNIDGSLGAGFDSDLTDSEFEAVPIQHGRSSFPNLSSSDVPQPGITLATHGDIQSDSDGIDPQADAEPGEAAYTDTARPETLEEGEVYVEYHPASGRRPEVLDVICSIRSVGMFNTLRNLVLCEYGMSLGLPMIGIVINLHVYADATRVTSFGNVKYWPVYMWIANVPKRIRTSRDKGRATLIAYLPVVHGEEGDNDSHLVQHRAEVYHRALEVVFETLEIPSKYGMLLSMQSLKIQGYPTAKKAVLKAESLRDTVVNIFLFGLSMFLSLYRMFVTDPLHQIEQGIHGRYSHYVESIHNNELIGLSFSWIKNHLFAVHTVDCLRRKGPHDNYAASFGESLHRQTKRDYARTSRQPDSLDAQMTRMAEERDAIMQIAERVHAYDAELEANPNDESSVPERDNSVADQRLRLGVRDKPCSLSTFVQIMAGSKEGIPLDRYARKLARFLSSHFDATVSDRWVQGMPLRRFYCMRIKYVSMESGGINQDIVRATPKWRRTGPRHDTVIVDGGEDGVWFGRVYMLCEIHVNSQAYHLVYLRRFGYIRLVDDQEDTFVFAESIVRTCHIVTLEPDAQELTVQDITDPDIMASDAEPSQVQARRPPGPAEHSPSQEPEPEPDGQSAEIQQLTQKKRKYRAKIQRLEKQANDMQKALRESKNNEADLASRLGASKARIAELEDVSFSGGSDTENNPKRRRSDGKGLPSEGVSESVWRAALHAGKKFAATVTLWPDAALFGELPENVEDCVSESADSFEHATEASEQAWQMVQQLPNWLRTHVHEKWFKERRQGIPEVQELLKDNAFLYDRPIQSRTDRVVGHMRGPSIMKSLKYLLNGPSAATSESGAAHPKARASNARLWALSGVTDALLVAGATVNYFVLTGAAEFSEQSGEYDFLAFYNKRLELLRSLSQSRQQKTKYDDIVAYYNHELFPDQYPEEQSNDEYTNEERDFLDSINHADDDDDGAPATGSTRTTVIKSLLVTECDINIVGNSFFHQELSNIAAVACHWVGAFAIPNWETCNVTHRVARVQPKINVNTQPVAMNETSAGGTRVADTGASQHLQNSLSIGFNDELHLFRRAALRQVDQPDDMEGAWVAPPMRRSQSWTERLAICWNDTGQKEHAAQTEYMDNYISERVFHMSINDPQSPWRRSESNFQNLHLVQRLTQCSWNLIPLMSSPSDLPDEALVANIDQACRESLLISKEAIEELLHLQSATVRRQYHIGERSLDRLEQALKVLRELNSLGSEALKQYKENVEGLEGWDQAALLDRAKRGHGDGPSH